MIFPLLATLLQTFFELLLGVVAVFLILLVLVQRGRGGGLAGALGGAGGSSAFGAKAGDVFTRVTIVAAAVWILLCIAAAKLGPSSESRIHTQTGSPAAAPAIVNLPRADEDTKTSGAGAETADHETTAGENTGATPAENPSAAGGGKNTATNGAAQDGSDGDGHQTQP